MALEKITQVSGRGVHVPGNDIDTDRIIPARFMKCVTFDGLGEFAFFDVRHDPQGNKIDHPIDRPEHKGATILLSGANFGCGSSREHAPQAISKAGFKAIIAENFAEIFFGNSTTLGMPCVAEIFFGNSTTLGMPCVSASREDIAKIAAYVNANPDKPITIDLEKMEVRFGTDTVKITQRESARAF